MLVLMVCSIYSQNFEKNVLVQFPPYIFNKKKVITASLYLFRNSIVSVCCLRLTIFPCPLPDEFGTHFYSRGSHSYSCCLRSDDFWAVTNDLVRQCCPGFLNNSFLFFSFSLYMLVLDHYVQPKCSRLMKGNNYKSHR